MATRHTRRSASPRGERGEPAAATGGFSDEERAAMRDRARELAARGRRAPADLEAEVLAKIDELPDPDRVLARRLHALVREVAPELEPRTWYGMPAYALGGKVVCFFQSGARFKTRYATLGFSDAALLDDGDMWPVAFAVASFTPEVEARVAALVRRAVGREPAR